MGRGRKFRVAATVAFVFATVAVTVPTSAAPVVQKDKQAPILYTQNATGGTLVADPARPGEFELTLTGTAANTTWFTDTPARRAGLYPTAAAIKMISFDGEKAPNAVLNLLGGEKDQDTLAITLREPSYDEEQGTLRFRVKPLGTVRRTGLRAYANDLDSALPESFGPSALFIDDVKVDPNPIVESCFMSIRFVKTSIPIYFLGAQDLIPNGGHWKGIPEPGLLENHKFNAVGEFGTDNIICRGGFLFGLSPQPGPGETFFVHMNNPYLSASDWGCPTVPGTWICHIDGNSHGQPLRVTATME
jgi:hypothetical protein